MMVAIGERRRRSVPVVMIALSSREEGEGSRTPLPVVFLVTSSVSGEALGVRGDSWLEMQGLVGGWFSFSLRESLGFPNV